jgi:molecular chaperone GrpE
MAQEKTPPTPPEPEAEPAAEPTLGFLQGELERALDEAAEWKDKAMRARADYDNLHKRTARDAALERERNKARVLEGLLPLVELAHMAAHQAELHPGPLSEGITMLAREFDRMLEREGVARIGAVGEKADPAHHEILATEAADGVEPGCVSRIVQPGYLLGDKMLRYAKVCVAPAVANSKQAKA